MLTKADLVTGYCSTCEVTPGMRLTMQFMGMQVTGSLPYLFDAGHLIGNGTGGAGNVQNNLVPLCRTVNRGGMNMTVEKRLRTALGAATTSSIDLAVEPVYMSTVTGVPTAIKYSFTINGVGGGSISVSCVILNNNQRQPENSICTP